MHDNRDPTKCKCKNKTVDIVSVILTIAIVIMSIGLLGSLFEPSSSSGGGYVKVEGSISGSVTAGGVLDKKEENTDNTATDTDNNEADADTETNTGTETDTENNNNNEADTDTDTDIENQNVWELVTDVSSLAVGDSIVIVANEYDYAISTTQNANNRAQASVVKNDNTVTFGDDVQIITLEAGTIENTFAFNVGNGYLRSASTTANTLKTQESNDDSSSWSISIVDNVATIVAQGSGTRNYLNYNKTSKLFACYETASQCAVSIYKLTTDDESEAILFKQVSLLVENEDHADYRYSIYCEDTGEWFNMFSGLGTMENSYCCHINESYEGKSIIFCLFDASSTENTLDSALASSTGHTVDFDTTYKITF